jgi:type I restriction enzyme R subunit
MLDTGIDVPEIVNLVFFKLVRSKTKFWQMLGRGTRLSEDLFGPGEDKREFIIFDYCQNLDFFDANPDGYESGVPESVKQQTFKRRLELAYAIQEAQPDDKKLGQFADQLKEQMHAVVAAMNLDNFIVRKHRREVETFAKRERWLNLSENDMRVLADKLSKLPSHDDDDEYSRRFDLLILNLQLAILQNSKAQENYLLKIRKIAHGLESKSAIPGVNAQMELIMELQTDAWWRDVTLPMLEEVRLRLRELVRFIDPEEGLQDVYTNFEDEIGEGSGRYVVVKSDPNLKDYRKRVQRFINAHQNHITIRRLKSNEPVSETDITALEEILFAEEGPIPREEYEKLYGEKPPGLLVRSVVGLDRNAAKLAFAEFLDMASLHPDQINFLNDVVEYLVKNGTMQPKIMFNPPFTNIKTNGIAGIFDEDDSKKVIELVRHVNENANVA